MTRCDETEEVRRTMLALGTPHENLREADVTLDN